MDDERWQKSPGKSEYIKFSFLVILPQQFVVSHDGDDDCLLVIVLLLLSAADTALLGMLRCSSTSFFDSSDSTTPMEEIIGSWRIRILNSSLVVPSLMQMFGPQAVVTLFQLHMFIL